MVATFVNEIELKDSVLHRLADFANVAQFVSFEPTRRQRHSRVRGFETDHPFASIEQAAQSLLGSSGSVNVRSFEPAGSKSREFIYGLTSDDEVVSHVQRLADQGLYTIVNETIDINDGGVSGVLLGNIVEFSPRDTPRCVEKPGTLSLPRELAFELLEKVYGFAPDFSWWRSTSRIEFSIHPLRRGTRQQHTILWEMEDVGEYVTPVEINWPNNFSRFIGDKTFGLLLADLLGLPVPATVVVPRFLSPFSFGRRTGSNEMWIRTCPTEQEPGRYTTRRGWVDPFKLMNDEDPEGNKIASMLAQEGVNAEYSGSLIIDSNGDIVMQGARGYGDMFMLGKAIDDLPSHTKASVAQLYEAAAAHLGPVRFEWVHDGETAWIIQIHKGGTLTLGNTIFPGEAAYFHRFDVRKGIEALRELIARIAPSEGIVLVGRVGITSHLGDILRKAAIPSRIEAE